MKYYCFWNKYPRAYQDLELFRTQIYRKASDLFDKLKESESLKAHANFLVLREVVSFKMLFCLIASVLLRRSHLTPCLGRCGGALKDFILNNLKYDILQSIWRMWPCIRPVEAPGWLLACKVSLVWSRRFWCWQCVDLWRVFSMLQPSSPLGSKAIRWMEKPVRAKKHVTSIPQACTALVHKL